MPRPRFTIRSLMLAVAVTAILSAIAAVCWGVYRDINRVQVELQAQAPRGTTVMFTDIKFGVVLTTARWILLLTALGATLGVAICVVRARRCRSR